MRPVLEIERIQVPMVGALPRELLDKIKVGDLTNVVHVEEGDQRRFASCF